MPLDYQAAQEFLLGRVNYERSAQIPYGRRDFKLDRMQRLLEWLGNPQQSLPIVHVAGTKGKGSTAAITAAILAASGRRTGLYTSPHLEFLEQRLAIDDQPCSHEQLAELVSQVRPVVEMLDAEAAVAQPASHGPTYFEILTAMALVHFARARLDAAVLEVGLGGRLDSTNVCRPLVSIITSISFDHTMQLGNTLAQIAREKAGIIKPGVPVVSGVLAREPQRVIESIAAEIGAPLVQLGRDFDVSYRPPVGLDAAAAPAIATMTSRAAGREFVYRDVEVALVGEHQAANAALAAVAVAELRAQGWSIPEQAVRRGLRDVRWPARIEVLRRHPTVVLDAAHNVASVEALVRVLGESFASRERLLVFATTRDKDVSGMLLALAPHFDRLILTRYQNNPRGVPVERLAELCASLGVRQPLVCPNSAAAWEQACKLATPESLICITGSFFIASEMQARIRARPIGDGE